MKRIEGKGAKHDANEEEENKQGEKV